MCIGIRAFIPPVCNTNPSTMSGNIIDGIATAKKRFYKNMDGGSNKDPRILRKVYIQAQTQMMMVMTSSLT